MKNGKMEKWKKGTKRKRKFKSNYLFKMNSTIYNILTIMDLSLFLTNSMHNSYDQIVSHKLTKSIDDIH